MSYEFGAWQAEKSNHADALTVLNQANADIRFLNRVVRERNERIAELEDLLAVSKAEARYTQFTALKTQYPDSPLFSDSGKRLLDGKVKTKIRLIFEAAFDVAARKFGIVNPAARRDN